MKIIINFMLLMFCAGLLAVEPHFASDPAISPDGKQVCFSYESDLWLVAYAGGEAKRLTVTDGDESGPVFSPDGKQIAFNSDRNGYDAIYIIPATGGVAREVTSERVSVVEWFKDGKFLLAIGADDAVGSKFYKISTDGKEILDLDLIGNFYCSLASDDSKIIFNRYGYPYREAYMGSKNGELWEYDFERDEYLRLTHTDYTERYPVYSKTGNGVYFAASDGNIFQLYNVKGDDFTKREQLTDFKTWSVRDISIARENDRLVFEHFDELWKYDSQLKKAQKIDIVINQDFRGKTEVREEAYNDVENYTVSPDGKWIAFSHGYDLFAVPAKGGEVKQITFTQQGIDDIAIMDDNVTLFFTAYEEGYLKLYKTNLNNFKDIEKLDWNKDRFIEYIRKDGNGLTISYSEGEERKRIAYMDSTYQDIVKIVDDEVVTGFAPRAELDYAFFIQRIPEIYSRHIYLYDFKKNRRIKMLNYDAYLNNLVWGKDNNSLFFGVDGDIKRLALSAKDDFYDDSDRWKEVYDDSEKNNLKKEKEDQGDDNKIKEEKSQKEALVIDTDDARNRVCSVVSRDGWNYIVHVLDDSTFYYMNDYQNKLTMRKTDYKGENDKVICSFNSGAERFHYDESSNVFYYTEHGFLKKFDPITASSESVDFDYKYKYDKLKLFRNTFNEIWGAYGRKFYDPGMHGRDWKEMKERYSKYLQYCYNGNVLQSIVDEMIGEVNASHSEFSAHVESKIERLNNSYGGFVLDYTKPLEKGIKIKKIYRKSKLNKPYGIKEGDILLSVDGVEIKKGVSVASLFLDKVGEKIRLEVKSGDSTATVVIRGLSRGQQGDMFYDNWVAERAEKVAEYSDGKIGYLHVRSMDNPSFNRFFQDLFAENYSKEALIIDVRNNGGGNISDDLIDVLTKKKYAITSSRLFGAKKVSAPGNVWDKPVVLLIDENSMSDAEIFPIIFKELKVGKIIGMPTSGYVIGTRSKDLMDGSRMRLPSEGWYRMNGVNMEGNGALPDIEVRQTFKQILADDDVQLKRAVKELFMELEKE